MAILTAKFKYPAYPRFSDRLKKLIAEMLTEDPRKRPNIYQVIAEICSMRDTAVPIKDIYAARTHSEARSNQRLPRLPSPESNVKPASGVGSQRIAVEQTRQTQPEITPMRRGRPRSPSKQDSVPSSVGKKERDPFAALDSPSFNTRTKAIDQLSARYPPADHFSLLQNRRTPFDFEGCGAGHRDSLDQDTSNLADQAFGVSMPDKRNGSDLLPDQTTSGVARVASLRRARERSSPRLQSPATRPNTEKPLPAQPIDMRADTALNPDPPRKPFKPPVVSDRPIWRVPEIMHDRSPEPSTNRSSIAHPDRSDSLQPPRRPSVADRPRPSSQFLDRTSYRDEESARPSMDSLRPPALSVPQSLHRSRSADEPTLSPTRTERKRFEAEAVRNASRGQADDDFSERGTAVDDSGPESSVDYLREMEYEGTLPPREKGHRRSSSMFKHLKHASMPPMSGAGKNIFGGKFGNAFKRFESGAGSSRRTSERDEVDARHHDLIDGNSPPRVASPDIEDSSLVETEELPPEVRRELERRRLSLEEKRVAEAGAAHRAGLSSGSRAGPNRASAIQNRVKNLLDESGRTSPVKKTAQGYGRYTEEDLERPISSTLPARPTAPTPSSALRQPPQLKQKPPDSFSPISASAPLKTAPATMARPTARPAAPPKPVALTTKAADPRAVITNPSELDWQYDFTTRYPDLSLDMVESEIAGTKTPPRTTSLRVREV